jgi:hypothetical protein
MTKKKYTLEEILFTSAAAMAISLFLLESETNWLSDLVIGWVM